MEPLPPFPGPLWDEVPHDYLRAHHLDGPLPLHMLAQALMGTLHQATAMLGLFDTMQDCKKGGDTRAT
ncbi:hypothetical protein NX774_08140 [Massilia agilis]|uniref:Uncharacterized protein n=1 Tax=Massilia agilis TaxID=1811226 RepID=A0ABT2DBV3_9BURK|nr:hypothetical protein [Massilia agilis]MCS0807891.1 hypothetical protein [Massilia agilis]